MRRRKLCGAPLPKAKNGAVRGRGTCERPKNHSAGHGARACYDCGVRLTVKNVNRYTTAQGSGTCRNCKRAYQRLRLGSKPRIYQELGAAYTFPCGCSGVLPMNNEPSKFVVYDKRFHCRVATAIIRSQYDGRKRGYASIPISTPHSVIRKMMEQPNCELCGESLVWEFGLGKTPHLHHNHETGEVYGFTHSSCNPRALEREIGRLKVENKLLRAA
jgi:hypothetical protein